MVKAIEIGNSERVEPATTALAPGGRAELTSPVVKCLGQLSIFRRQGAFAYARGISLHNSDDATHPVRRHARARTGAAGRRVRGSNIRIRAVIDVEKCALC